MDDLLKELRNFLADTRKREDAAERRHKEIVDAIREGFVLISHVMQDARR